MEYIIERRQENVQACGGGKCQKEEDMYKRNINRQKRRREGIQERMKRKRVRQEKEEEEALTFPFATHNTARS